MAKSKKQSQAGDEKKLSAALSTAMHESDEHRGGGGHADAVPPAETGGHSHSAAAHLNSKGAPHTKPAGNLRQGADPGALREPPMVVQRVGKQHK